MPAIGEPVGGAVVAVCLTDSVDLRRVGVQPADGPCDAQPVGGAGEPFAIGRPDELLHDPLAGKAANDLPAGQVNDIDSLDRQAGKAFSLRPPRRPLKSIAPDVRVGAIGIGDDKLIEAVLVVVYWGVLGKTIVQELASIRRELRPGLIERGGVRDIAPIRAIRPHEVQVPIPRVGFRTVDDPALATQLIRQLCHLKIRSLLLLGESQHGSTRDGHEHNRDATNSHTITPQCTQFNLDQYDTTQEPRRHVYARIDVLTRAQA